jgi:hypothetical protein
LGISEDVLSGGRKRRHTAPKYVTSALWVIAFVFAVGLAVATLLR